MSKQWGGRFEGKTDALVESFGQSVSFDKRLALYDIYASIAHARMLGKQGIVSKKDATAIVRTLTAIRKEIEAEKFEFNTQMEDVHTNIEAALVARCGDAGKRLHTARSRNDQVATDIRLWTRDQIDRIVDLLRSLQRALISFADSHVDVILPGCTHLQHAQPVLFAHHLLAYFEMFDRDRDRFSSARTRVNVLPLGAAALAGTPHRIDREFVARELGFDSISANSMDAVSDRDFAIEFCSAAALTMMHLSRLCEELILWSTSEFDYIEIGDAFTTGSSIMPQKKNPDVAELVRGKTGRVYGSLVALLTLMKALPLTYNRDMQEDKEALFDASDTLQQCLEIVAAMLPAIKVKKENMLSATQKGFLEATDMADYLVAKGLPFRRAHEIVGRLVLLASRTGRTLPELSLEEMHSNSGLFSKDIVDSLKVAAIVAKRDTLGSTAPRRVREALRKALRSV